jgi:hypothetical protein
MPRKATTATMTPDAATPGSRQPTTAGEVFHANELAQRSNESFQRSLTTYRAAVESAANADGQLPVDQLDAIVDACRVTGIPVEQFPEDVESFRKFREVTLRHERLESEMDSRRAAAEAAVREVARLEVELQTARNNVRLNSDHFIASVTHAAHDRNEMVSRLPHMFADAASVTRDTVKRKLTTRAYFVG